MKLPEQVPLKGFRLTQHIFEGLHIIGGTGLAFHLIARCIIDIEVVFPVEILWLLEVPLLGAYLLILMFPVFFSGLGLLVFFRLCFLFRLGVVGSGLRIFKHWIFKQFFLNEAGELHLRELQEFYRLLELRSYY
ncbi:MAG: hypothetical protein BWY40_00393 [bacterium ADurb.Bin270]|nr:MAG: hypothetical protein BWY40_00393 [bacterium ADurb.Bin270]